MKMQDMYNTILKYNKYTVINPTISLNIRSNYSTSSSPLPSKANTAYLPIKVFFKLNDENCLISYRSLLKNKGGVYTFINTVNNKQYVGSAKYLYVRLAEHISNKKLNKALQNAFDKYGLDKFKFCIYEYFTYDSKTISGKALTDLETSYIERFDFDTLYNFMKTATSLTGYKHSHEARLKMVKRLEDKTNHPMFGKTHDENTLKLISKPGELNPMFGQKHAESTKEKISDRLSKHPSGVGIYDLSNNLIIKFKNNSKLADYLNI